MLNRYFTYVLCITLLAIGKSSWSSSTPSDFQGSMSTRERVASNSWWPTSGAADRKSFVGAQACASCHAEIVHQQATSQMAHTLMYASRSEVLQQHMRQQYQSGPYTYTLSRQRDLVKLKVSNKDQSDAADLLWAFGSGQVGQSYLWLNQDGSFREARFNYFSSIGGFDATPGRLHGHPADMATALGRPVEAFEARTCFACHTTGLTAGSALNETGFSPGISCEACHGPGAQHIAAMKAAEGTTSGRDLHITNPARMTPAQSVDFCGSCHSTPWDVRLMGAVGLQTVRSPAYRLEKSQCWGTTGDMRLTCQSCHNPHAPLEHAAAAYDVVCLQCHANSGAAKLTVSTATEQHPGKACPVATSKCTTCHMPRYELPEMHSKFTDHMIRIVRPNTAIPD